jgi:hypothetical protein
VVVDVIANLEKEDEIGLDMMSIAGSIYRPQMQSM